MPFGTRDEAVEQLANPTPFGARDEDMTPPAAPVTQAGPTEATNPLQGIKAGFQRAGTTMMMTGKKPSVVVPENAGFFTRNAANLSELVSDTPTIVGGFLTGQAVGGMTAVPLALASSEAAPVVMAAGETMGGGAGAMMAPAIVRELALAKIENRAPNFDAKQLAALGLIGAVTAGTATASTEALAKWLGPEATTGLQRAMKIGVPTSNAFVANQISVAMAQGRLPTAKEFEDNAVLMFGPFAVAAGAAKLRSIYAKTGVRPADVRAIADTDPRVRDMIAAGDSPEAIVAKSTDMQGRTEPKIQVTKPTEVTPGPEAEKTLNTLGTADPVTWTKTSNVTNDASVTQLLSDVTANYQAKIEAETRGRVSNATTAAQAAEAASFLEGTLGDKAVLDQHGMKVNAAELLARRDIARTAAERASALAEIARKPDATTEQKAQALAAIEQASTVTATFLGQRAEAGRTLQALQMSAADVGRARALQNALRRVQNPDELFSAVADMKPDEMLRASKQTSWLNDAMFLRKMLMLTNPKTWFANGVGNALSTLLRVPVDLTAGVVSAVMRTGQDATPGARAGEAAADLYGMIAGGKDALKAGLEAYGKAQQRDTPVTQLNRGVIGKAGEAVGRYLPLEAMDQFNRVLNYRMSLQQMAYRQAMDEGAHLNGTLKDRITDLVTNPTKDMMAQAKADAEKFTFTQKMGGPLGRIVAGINESTFGQFLVPFSKTPINIARAATRMTPAAVLVKGWREDFAAGGAARDRAVAEVLLGTSVISTIFNMVDNGQITGQGPINSDQKQMMMSNGWRPNSFIVGNTVIDYNRMDPLAMTLSSIATLRESSNYMTEKEREYFFFNSVAHTMTQFKDKTMVGDFADLLDAGFDGQKLYKWVEKRPGTFVPGVGSLITAPGADFQREINGALDGMQDRVGMLRDGLMPKRDIFGEPIKKPQDGWVSPIAWSHKSDDPVRNEMERLAQRGFPISFDQAKDLTMPGVPLPGYKMEDAQRNEMAHIVGMRIHDILDPIIRSDGYRSAETSNEVRAQIVRTAADAMRAATVAEFRGKNIAELKAIAEDYVARLNRGERLPPIKEAQ